MIRVLQTAALDSGGVGKIVTDWNENIDLDEIHFDYLVYRNREEFYDEKLKLLGAKKFIIDIENKSNYFEKCLYKYKELCLFFKHNKFDIVHINASNPTEIFVAIAAKKYSNAIVFFHSHNDVDTSLKGIRKLASDISKVFVDHFSDYELACSKTAGRWIFQKKFEVLNNGLLPKKFAYSEVVSREMKVHYKLEDNKIVGHIGRFCYQKNQEYLLEIFEELYSVDNKYRLVLVGDGENKDYINKIIYEKGLSNVVTLIPPQNDVVPFFQMFDVFVLPSRYEGLGIVGIEAQAAGLPTVISDVIPEEIDVTDLVYRLSLDETPQKWAECIQNVIINRRVDRSSDIIQAGYSIKDTALKLSSMYKNAMKERIGK